ncbi:MAG: hypothetical protein IKR38_00990 [Bacteroidales bacterium]|nr:hypothetical protein [Bacteroidales bacterium]
MMDDKVKGYWHVYSDGKRADIPFGTDDDKTFAMNAIAISAYHSNMEVVCLEVNDTHLHTIVKGENVDGFRSGLKKRITSRLGKTAGGIFLAANEIQTRDELLVKIIYTFRNCLDFYRGAPWDYRWGVGNLYFAQRKTAGTAMEDLPVRLRRKLLNIRLELPGSWRVDDDGMIIPSSYIDVEGVERLFGSIRAFLAFLHIKKDDELRLKQSFSSNYIEQRSILDIREHANRISHQKFRTALRNLDFKSRLEIASSMLRSRTATRSESLAKAVYLKKADLDRLL